MVDFVHLHLHTQYSILDGATNIEKLIAKAIKDNMKALAITDHGNMFGAKIFHNEAIKAGIKPILGCEAYISRTTRFDKKNKEDRSGYHLILLAKNEKGYNNLIKLISLSWIEGFYYTPRIDKELLKEYSEGLIASSACLGGEVPQNIMKRGIDSTKEVIKEYRDIFGEDFYLELQRHESGNPEKDKDVFERQQEVNEQLLILAKELDIKCIATNDVHFLNAGDSEAHDRLICINTGKDLDDPTRMRYTKQEYLKTRQEMNDIFSDHPEILSNTLEIADKIEIYELNRKPVMPEYDIPVDFGTVEGYKSQYSEKDLIEEFTEERYIDLGGFETVSRIKMEYDYLKKITYDGAIIRWGEISEEIDKRLDYELGIIKKMGYPGYFLIVYDILNAAREMNVSVGPGRGSAAGSAVAYSINITDVDPIKYNLLFERFLNPERISLPDIDIDFDDDGRDDVLNWVVKKYGKNRVAHVVTFGTMATKMAIRDVARVQKLPLSDANYLAKLVPTRPGTKFTTAYKEVDELKKAKTSTNPLIVETLKYAEELEGSIRQTGIHACGIIIGPDDLKEYIPLCVSKESDLLVTQFDGKHIEDVGMLKMDFLGLKTLSIIKDAVENVRLYRGIEIDINSVPLDDKATYELYSRGETTGLFQFESDGMKKYLKELKPNRFDDLIAMNALYRPGPMEHIPSFIKRKHGEEEIIYTFPEMEEYLEETYGITVYQEQVMLLSQKMAGFTGGQADTLRKAMGKKKKDVMDELKVKFLDGCKNNNLGEEKVKKIWSDWEAFANYAFNKSHSTCYSYLSFQTAYLKTHYPSEFMAAVLSRNLADIKKITLFMDECKRMGINVLGPDVNESHIKFFVNKNSDIRFGLEAIKGVGESAAQQIINERSENGNYKDIYDFVTRVNLQTVNKRNLEALAYSGGFDCFDEIDRHQFFLDDEKGSSFIETLIRFGGLVQEEKNTIQQSLFGESNDLQISKPSVSSGEAWSNIYQLTKEKELIGIYLSAHPLDVYKLEIDNFCNKTLDEFHDLESQKGKKVSISGIVSEAFIGKTRKGTDYGTITLNDYNDSFKIAFFGNDFVKYKNFITEGYLLLIKGIVQKKGFYNSEDLEFKVDNIEMLTEVKKRIKNITIKLPVSDINEEFISDSLKLVKRNKGNANLKFIVFDTNEKIVFDLFSREYKVNVSTELLEFYQIKYSLEIKVD